MTHAEQAAAAVRGVTTEQVIRDLAALVDGAEATYDPEYIAAVVLALRDRYDRKAERRDRKATESAAA